MFGAAAGHKAHPVSGAGMPAWQAGCEEEDAGDTLSCSPQQAGRQGGGGSAVVRGQGPAATPPRLQQGASGASGVLWGNSRILPLGFQSPLPPCHWTRGSLAPPSPCGHPSLCSLRSQKETFCLTPTSGDCRSRSTWTQVWCHGFSKVSQVLHPSPGSRF